MSIKNRINHQIGAREVRLLGSDGSQKGILPLQEALKMANEEGLDLVEISPHATPPVCKIMDWGKFKYEQKREQKKKQKNFEVKGIRLSAKIGEHDFNTKLKHAKKFLENGNKVKIRLFFKGREIVHKDLGQKVMENFAQETKDIADIEQEIKFAGREITMVIGPKTKNKKEEDENAESKNT